MTDSPMHILVTGIDSTSSKIWEDSIEGLDQNVLSGENLHLSVSDRIVRYVTTTANFGMPVGSWRTQDVMKRFQTLLNDKDEAIECLKSVAVWQKHRLDYQAVYNAYLLEAIDEDEFIEESERFSRDCKQIAPALIADRITKISGLLSFNLGPTDYADYFGVEVDAVKEASKLLPTSVCRRMVEHDDMDDQTGRLPI